MVMGHSHTPVATQLHGEHPTWYVNTGTWIPPRGRVRHEGACTCQLTHLAVLANAAGIHGELRRWCTAARRPEAMAAVGVPPA